MRHQGWRWLWIWVGVLAAGCGQIWSSDNSATSTREPTLPLWGYTLVPPALTPTAWPVQTDTPLIPADNAGSATLAVHLHVQGAACYETPVGSMVCLGQIRNQWDSAVAQVTVIVQLLAADGTPLVTQETPLSRSVLPSGAVGPFRALFETLPEGYAGARAFVSAGSLVVSHDTRYTNLTLQPASGAFVLDQYQVSLTVVNKQSHPVEQIAITMMLLDRNGLVTGFRRVPVNTTERLEPGEALALTLKVIPQGSNTIAFEAYAEGYYALN
ncbi:MAG: hypothetical protein K8S97_07955 [Anaerolineae bacterium]|nr:hypothetical protein [Anaerolineae bacterium]